MYICGASSRYPYKVGDHKSPKSKIDFDSGWARSEKADERGGGGGNEIKYLLICNPLQFGFLTHITAMIIFYLLVEFEKGLQSFPQACKCVLQWNLIITRSDITKSSYNEVILLVPALYISLFFYPDIMRNLI